MAYLPPDQSALERHVLYILLDSNLPTGGFVASSGLESYAKHGFFSSSHLTSLSDIQGSARGGAGIQEAVVDFAQSSVMNYAKSTLAFVKDAWTLLDRLQTAEAGNSSKEATVATLKKLDDLYEAMTLNHVTRRSSTAQGIALLTLLTKGFAPPNLNFPARSTKANVTEEGGEEEVPLWWKSSVDTFKRIIRRGEAHGHLPVCWGVLTRAMGLSLGELLLPIFVLYETLSSIILSVRHDRTLSSPPPLPTRPVSPIIRRSAESHRAVRIDAIVIAFLTTLHRSRNTAEFGDEQWDRAALFTLRGAGSVKRDRKRRGSPSRQFPAKSQPCPSDRLGLGGRCTRRPSGDMAVGRVVDVSA